MGIMDGSTLMIDLIEAKDVEPKNIDGISASYAVLQFGE